MQKCTLFVLTSKLETFGCVLTEAQACGKPVVTTACGGPETIISENSGIMVDSFSPEQFAQAIKSVICGQKKFNGDFIRARICRLFGKKVFVKKTLACYKSLLN
jgi:glycosyltransferase involved in cell wall biosynthesis